MKKTTIVKNVITEEKETYYNSYSLIENLVSSIINIKKQNSNLLNTELREKLSHYVKIIPSKKGGFLAYSDNYDLIAYEQ